jgi:MerR family transcriptional regulator, mercuric resistance operon regulatory protein
MVNQRFTIGVLAGISGVNVETVRYYQRRGLLAEPPKPLGGVRHYSESDASRIYFIKSAQRLGFTLEEVSLLLKLEDGTHCAEARTIAEQKLANVRAKLADLQSIEQVLSGLVNKCNISRGKVCCPLIASIQHAHVAVE